jgi:CRISPR-associated endoribonuclease Cas6
MSQLKIESANMAGLKLARFDVGLRAQESARLPAFSGSTLRGALGHALKKAVCVMDHRDCSNCLVASRCIYPYIFETPFPVHIARLQREQNAPHPFTLDPPIFNRRINIRQRVDDATPSSEENHSEPVTKWQSYQKIDAGDEIVFGLTLMGRAIDCLPFVVFAIHEMTQRGLGAGRFRFALNRVDWIAAANERKTIYTEGAHRLDPPREAARLSQLVEARMAEISAVDRLKLRFLTPMRIKVANDLQPQVDFALLVRNLLRRVSLLTAVHGDAEMELDYRGLITRAGEVKTASSDLRWWDLERYSNRQQTSMKIGGFVGSTVYEGAQIEDFLPLIVAGEILRVGRGTSFGLGKYEIATEGPDAALM